MSKAIEADDQQRKGSLTSAHSDASAVDKARRKTAAKDCCKKAIKFLFSHIGLCGMVVAYSVAGGFIFQHLEQTNEKTECEKSMEKYIEMENSTNYKLWEVAKAYSSDVDDIESEENALGEYKEILEKFRTDVIDLGYGGQNCTIMGQDGGPAYEWSFAGALLFSVTVITTIGYGNISPATFWGRLVVLAYATIGIPLTLLMLANIGDVMADCFRFVYAKLCCCGILNRKDKDEVERVSINSKGPTPEAWPSNYPDQEAEGHPDQVEEEEEEEEDEEEEEAPVSVPLTVTVGLLCGYLLMGSVMFSAWEGWEPLAAAYFSYVTISTVGFGDLVPSTNYETAGDVGRLLGSALYIIFGLALLSMCFALIQEEIECKAAWLKERFGKKKEAEEEGEEAEEEGRKSSRENAETGEKESPSPTMDKEKIY